MQPQGAKSDICTYTKHIQNLLPAPLHLHLKRVVLLEEIHLKALMTAI